MTLDGITLPRFAWHRPPWSYDIGQGLRSYQPAGSAEGSGEADAIRRAFSPRAWRLHDKNGLVQRHGLLWLAPEWPTTGHDRGYNPYAQNGVRVDLSKLDVERLRYSYGAEGYIWHLGPISADALVRAL